MSGLLGWVMPGGNPEGAALSIRMAKELTHYDWYRSIVLPDPQFRVGLGQVGIQVFNREDSPVTSVDGMVTVFFCGELYRTENLGGSAGINLAQMDSAAGLVLRIYEDVGEKGLSRLEGIYQIAIYDRRRSRLILSNDRFGLYPWFYSIGKGWFIFGPEMKAVAAAPQVKLSVDPTAVAQYLRFQFLMGDVTFFEAIRLLPAASVLTCNLENAEISITSYWDMGKIAHEVRISSYEDVVRQAGELLRDAVQVRLKGDLKPGVYLSGGLDSRVILGMAGKRAHSIQTLSYGQTGSRDLVYAARIADKAGSRHTTFEFGGGGWVKDYAPSHFTLTEGFHSWIHSHGISVLSEARALMDVNLNGLCGEELNWDDPYLYLEDNLPNYTSRLFNAMNQHTTWPSLSEGEEAAIFDATRYQGLRGQAYDSLRELVDQKSNLSPRFRTTALSTEVDRHLFLFYSVFNRSHIEQRYPFLDYRYIEFIHSLPVELLFHRRLRRDVIRRFCPHLTGIPNDKDNLPLGASESQRTLLKVIERGRKLATRPLKAFFPQLSTLYADYETWLRGELRDWGQDLLVSQRTLERGLFNPNFIRGMWDRFQNGGEVNVIGKLAPLMTLEMVFREFLDRRNVGR